MHGAAQRIQMGLDFKTWDSVNSRNVIRTRKNLIPPRRVQSPPN